MKIPEYNGNLRSNTIKVPQAIDNASGIRVFGRLIKSFVFSTDVAIIRNINADAVIAIYPFTPQPIITHALIQAADIPVFSGVGGGTTGGPRAVNLAMDAEQQGAMGVVLNAPTKNQVLESIKKRVEIPIIITVLSEKEDIQGRLNAGASIINVSAGKRTVEVVKKIRMDFPNVAIIATGGDSEESIQETIDAGANAITYTPPTTSSLFKNVMKTYRKE